ncbi:hypothetical protein MIC97_20975 [Aquamicrobium sp. NLF2-7]|uniref:MFS transporter n=1 Tax=Aquamicrobium sp. NLF2-7 TaxID=2918753 RepID=UPI001EFB3088|nr:MFS transporter [Aquamicrobium sp. NLF2-7]MCG8273808.1 hypothetical protein [Aquamicrobium sp. NLF2-7]MCG8273960.1 hypothetical protein [Aquamicrobium sp. NLF2-7]
MSSSRPFGTAEHSDQWSEFGVLAGEYNSRPKYPDEMIVDVAQLLEDSGSRDPTVVEIGAGTGIFTRLLAAVLPAQARIIAIEPSEEMRNVALQSSQSFRSIYAVNVSLPTLLLEEYSMDKVVPPFVLSGFVGAMMLGSVFTARQATRWPRHRAIVGGTIMILVISSLLLACSLLLHSPEVAMALLFAFACTVGFVSPMVLASAIGTAEGHVGLAAGSYGAVQMATGSLFAVLAGLLEYRLVGIASLLFLSAAISLLLQMTRPGDTRSVRPAV